MNTLLCGIIYKTLRIHIQGVLKFVFYKSRYVRLKFRTHILMPILCVRQIDISGPVVPKKSIHPTK